MLVVTGLNSTIIQALIALGCTPEVRVDTRGTPFCFNDGLGHDYSFPEPHAVWNADRYIFTAGVMHPKSIGEQTESEIYTSLSANLISVVQLCEAVLTHNDHARICVVGSASGECGSYDQVYAATKAGLHRYVETRKLRHPGQQLVCVAPGIIEDSGMTRRRKERQRLVHRRDSHPKGRFLRAIEVAKMIRFLLWEDEGYTTNVVIRMEGTVRCGG